MGLRDWATGNSPGWRPAHKHPLLVSTATLLAASAAFRPGDCRPVAALWRSPERFSRSQEHSVVSCDLYFRQGSYVFTCAWLSVCLLTGLLKNTNEIVIKFYRMIGHNQGTNRLVFEWPWPKVKVTSRQKVEIVSGKITPFKIILDSCHKIKL